MHNAHVHALNWTNVRWAFMDGQMLGVYEPFGAARGVPNHAPLVCEQV